MNQPPYPLERLFGRIRSPLDQFLRRTTAGGIVLIVATCAALLLATALGAEVAEHFWEQRFAGFTWHQWVNDALMALFFLVVGLELKREMLVGELSSLRDAALPVIAALGGMVAPAGIYAASTPAVRAPRGGASPWRRISPSPSASSSCLHRACREISSSSSWHSPSRTTLAPCW